MTDSHPPTGSRTGVRCASAGLRASKFVTNGPAAWVRASPILAGMGEIDGRTGLEVLDTDECLTLLSRCSLGRLAVVTDGRPLIFPVNFALDGTAVVFRNDPGTKVYAARNQPVAFECDGTDAVYHGAGASWRPATPSRSATQPNATASPDCPSARGVPAPKPSGCASNPTR